jgi:hypothetical protein
VGALNDRLVRDAKMKGAAPLAAAAIQVQVEPPNPERTAVLAI